MKENHIIVSKTARFFTLGELNEHTKNIFIVIHGWGMSAKSFLQSFDPLQTEQTFFVAPEALNRFYVKGSGGQVGATWMTREDRLNEIKDYLAYLDDIYELFDFEKYNHAHITAIGFSQGASTVTRWVNSTEKKIDSLIVYAGEVAPELLPLSENSGLKRTKNTFICGTRDEFFTQPLVAKMKDAYSELHFTEIEFEGKHEINLDALRKAL
jgi:predicted esterase